MIYLLLFTLKYEHVLTLGGSDIAHCFWHFVMRFWMPSPFVAAGTLTIMRTKIFGWLFLVNLDAEFLESASLKWMWLWDLNAMVSDCYGWSQIILEQRKKIDCRQIHRINKPKAVRCILSFYPCVLSVKCDHLLSLYSVVEKRGRCHVDVVLGDRQT